MEKWIIDTDAGVDDAQALILALSSNIDVVAITTVSGNTPESNVYKNVCEILRICEKDTKIYRGALRPIINQPEYCPDYHGEDGLNGYWNNHEPLFFPEENNEKASSAIVRLSKEHPGIGIICLGPLTNLATAFLLDPNLSFGRIEIMGGTLDSTGNVTELAEFNIYQDPEAAFIVFERAPHLVITPWETVDKPEIIVTPEVYESWNIDTKKARFLREIVVGRFQLCDGIAVAAAIDPSIITEYEERGAYVELGGNYSRGHTVVRKSDRFLKKNPPKNFKFIRTVDPQKFYKMVLSSLA